MVAALALAVLQLTAAVPDDAYDGSDDVGGRLRIFNDLAPGNTMLLNRSRVGWSKTTLSIEGWPSAIPAGGYADFEYEMEVDRKNCVGYICEAANADAGFELSFEVQGPDGRVRLEPDGVAPSEIRVTCHQIFGRSHTPHDTWCDWDDGLCLEIKAFVVLLPMQDYEYHTITYSNISSDLIGPQIHVSNTF